MPTENPQPHHTVAHNMAPPTTATSAKGKERDDRGTQHEIQVDLLMRLRVIEQLQSLTYPRIIPVQDDELLVRILDWLCTSFVVQPRHLSISAALSARKGHVTLFVSHSGPHISDKTTKGEIQQAVDELLTTMREVLALSMRGLSPDVCLRLLFRTVIISSWPRIQRKLSLISSLEGDLSSTIYAFNALLNTWLTVRPDGENSPGIRAVLHRYANKRSTNACLLQLFVTVVQQAANAEPERMSDEERYTHYFSLFTACYLLFNSTFFYDIVNHHSLRLSLKMPLREFKSLCHISFVMRKQTFMLFGFC